MKVIVIMDYVLGIILGVTILNVRKNNLTGGGNRKPDKIVPTPLEKYKRNSPEYIQKYLISYLKDEDIAYTPLIQNNFGTMPQLDCDCILAARNGKLNILRKIVEKCDNCSLKEPNLDNENILLNTKKFTEDFIRNMEVRRKCLLEAAQNGHLHILKWLRKLKGFNYKHQWSVIYIMERNELFSAWIYAVENEDVVLLKFLENERKIHIPNEKSINSYFGRGHKRTLMEIVSSKEKNKKIQIIEKLINSDN